MCWSCEAARFKVGEPGADGPSPKIYSTWNQEASFFHPPQAEQELEDHVPGLVSSWKLPCWIVRRYQHHYWSVFINLTYEKCQYFIITILLQGVQEWAEVINAGNIKDLFMDRGLESVNLNSLKRLWRISGQVNNVESTSLFPVSFFLLLPNSLFINPLSILLLRWKYFKVKIF